MAELIDATEYRQTLEELDLLAAGPHASSDYRLCQALVDELQVLIPQRTVELVGDPRADRNEITDLRIRVRPAGWSQNEATRAYDRDTRTVHVGIVGPCRAVDLLALDTCLALCDQVRALWGRSGTLRNKSIGEHEPTGVLSQAPLYDERMLMADNLFVGNITVTYHRAN